MLPGIDTEHPKTPRSANRVIINGQTGTTVRMRPPLQQSCSLVLLLRVSEHVPCNGTSIFQRPAHQPHMHAHELITASLLRSFSINTAPEHRLEPSQAFSNRAIDHELLKLSLSLLSACGQATLLKMAGKASVALFLAVNMVVFAMGSVKVIGCSSLRGGGGELVTIKILTYGSN